MTQNEQNIEKQYTERDALALEPHYSRHMLAMTREELNGKWEIAAELAYRDSEIERLRTAFTKVAHDAYTRGRIDEAKTCKGCLLRAKNKK